ncbi:hypothetical protein KRX52_04505 [Pseudomonas sp. MAP12]|uniref:DUF2341 domain-containing protein n=1 Tax=Geopseudomonas aromaticivorans TaxID=2849492 RepID=A0ABS6MTB7_9GAMM|nr:LamG-like jellyroll fold domain-containing protein [Pseudomonas aromaticivorans]MBV2132058.1 hypothetical protein [Pseudomonas aromaticivorans]
MIPGIVASQRLRVAASQYRVAVTVPAASVGETLSGFPVYVDLASMPAAFWSVRPHKDGRDVRVKDAGGADLPFHLVRVNPRAKTGSLFVKLDLSSASPSTFYVHWGNAALSAVSGAPVWSDYHRVYLFHPSPTDGTGQLDVTGSGTLALTSGRNKRFGLASQSPALTEHQGICCDGAHYYVTDTNAINKYDMDWNLVASNQNPVGDVGGGVNHCGDPDVHAGLLYVPIESYTSPTVFSAQKIAVFRADTLEFVTAHDVSAQGAEVSGVCIDAAAGHLYTVAYAAGGFSAKKYSLDTMAFIESIAGAGTSTYIQGMTRFRERFYANADGQDYTYLMTDSGYLPGFSAATRQWTDMADNATSRAGNYEGIGSTDDELLILRDDGATSVVHVISPLSTEAGGGMDIVQASGENSYLSSSISDLSVFTLGCTVIPATYTSSNGNNAILSISTGVYSEDKRIGLVRRNATGKFGLWHTTAGWLDGASPVVSGTRYRLHARYNGGSSRALFVNGTKEAEQTAFVAPPAGRTTLYLGAEDTSFFEKFAGQIGFVYLRASLLSDQWIAAEASNLSRPGDFYTVGAAEPV